MYRLFSDSIKSQTTLRSIPMMLNCVPSTVDFSSAELRPNSLGIPRAIIAYHKEVPQAYATLLDANPLQDDAMMLLRDIRTFVQVQRCGLAKQLMHTAQQLMKQENKSLIVNQRRRHVTCRLPQAALHQMYLSNGFRPFTAEEQKQYTEKSLTRNIESMLWEHGFDAGLYRIADRQTGSVHSNYYKWQSKDKKTAALAAYLENKCPSFNLSIYERQQKEEFKAILRSHLIAT